MHRCERPGAGVQGEVMSMCREPDLILNPATARRRAAEIHLLAQVGTLQVRWHRGRLLTFRFPAPRGYGVRGELVATYNAEAPLEWIEADLVALAVTLTPSDTCALICA